MRQDPNAVPHPRASYEQSPDRQLPHRQLPHRQALDQPPEQWPPRPGYGTYDPAYDPAHDTASRNTGTRFRTDRSETQPFPPPWHQDARDAGGQAGTFGRWQDTAQPQPADAQNEAMLTQVRVAQRKARRMQVVSVLLGVCAAAIFAVTAASHQLDGQVEILTPVLLLSSAVNFRRYAQRAAGYRAAETDILTRVG